jgi:hypothetical protein
MAQMAEKIRQTARQVIRAGNSKAPPFIGGEESSAGVNPAALENYRTSESPPTTETVTREVILEKDFPKERQPTAFHLDSERQRENF